MANTISEEVSARFTADSTGLVKAVDTAKSKLAELRKAYSARTAAGEVKNTILNPQLLANKGLDKLIGSMKIGAVTGGALAAGITLAADAVSKFRDEANAANESTLALSENVRKLSNANTFTSASEGSSGLASRLAAIREQQIALREDQDRLNPPDAAGRGILNLQYAETRGSKGDLNGQGALQNDRQKNASEQQRLGQLAAKISPQLTESLMQQNRLSDDRLTGDQQTLQIAELRIQRQRELNDLRASGEGTPDRQNLIADRYDKEIEAQKQLRYAISGRYLMEVGIRSLKLSSLSADEQATQIAEVRVRQAKDELAARRGLLSVEERRQINDGIDENQVVIMQAQRRAAMEGPAARNRRFYRQSRIEARNERADARINATDGLVNAQRDANGRITGGIDMATGLARGVSPGFVQAQGLQTGALGSSFVKASFGQNRLVGSSLPGLSRDTGHDTDTAKGNTALSAARATVDALDIANAYHKNMSNGIDFLVAHWGFN